MSCKKALAVMLTLLFVVTAVAGCSGGSTNQPASTSSPSAGTTTPSADPGTASATAPKSNYPTSNINGIVAWGAGGATDNLCRVIAPLAEPKLGKTIIMSNKPGATGTIGTQYVYDQKADGYTLLFNAENPPLYRVLGLSDLSYDDFTPVMILAKATGVLVVAKDAPYQSYQDLIDTLKANPGKVNIGATGAGGLPYNCFSLIKKVEGVDYNLVVFDGDGPLITGMMSKEVNASVIGFGACKQYLDSDDFRALAVFSNDRIEEIPDIPALSEIKPEFESSLESWGPFYGVYVKKETPQDVVDTLTEAFIEAYNHQTFQEYCANAGVFPLGLTGTEAVDFIKTWEAETTWILYDAGGAVESPEKFGISRP